MVLFKSHKDVEIAEAALMARQEDIIDILTTVLCFLTPNENRRAFLPRRSGLDRRAMRAKASEIQKRRAADRRERRDRRVPSIERLQQMREELEQLFRLHTKLTEWEIAGL